VIFGQLVLAENCGAFVSDQMEVFDVAEGGSEDIDLGPVETHVDENQFKD
jgi:hypothetical protein